MLEIMYTSLITVPSSIEKKNAKLLRVFIENIPLILHTLWIIMYAILKEYFDFIKWVWHMKIVLMTSLRTIK